MKLQLTKNLSTTGLWKYLIIDDDDPYDVHDHKIIIDDTHMKDKSS